MPEAQSRWFYIVRQLQVAGKLSTKVAGNHLLLSVTGGSERCRSGSEISGARLYQRQGAERRSGGVEGCQIRDELIIACSNFRPSSSRQVLSLLRLPVPPLGHIERITAGLASFNNFRIFCSLSYRFG